MQGITVVVCRLPAVTTDLYVNQMSAYISPRGWETSKENNTRKLQSCYNPAKFQLQRPCKHRLKLQIH